MLEEKFTGNGKVVLLAGGGKIYTDIAARFVRSERDLEEIVASPYWCASASPHTSSSLVGQS